MEVRGQPHSDGAGCAGIVLRIFLRTEGLTRIDTDETDLKQATARSNGEYVDPSSFDVAQGQAGGCEHPTSKKPHWQFL